MSELSPTNLEPAYTPSVSDFKLSKSIGKGTFADVFKAQELSTGTIFAIKIMPKKPPNIRDRHNYINSIFMEKEALLRAKNDFVIALHYTFQDSARVYYVLEYAPRGEILTYLKMLTCFDIHSAKFYIAELFVALDYLHNHAKLCHRDLKPENILLSSSMHIKIIDFASAIVTDKDSNLKPVNFTGTPQYVSPEMLNPIEFGVSDSGNKYSHTYLMDFWAVACILFQFISGRYPFRGPLRTSHDYEIFKKILALEYSFPMGFDPQAKSLIESLFKLKPNERLGSPENGGHDSIRKHSFFAEINWNDIINTVPPKLLPNVPECVDDDDWDQIPTGYRNDLDLELNFLSINDDVESEINLKRAAILKEQSKNNIYARFTQDSIILKQAILKKRRGLSAKSRMFLLTEGPRLLYVDPHPNKMQLRGEVPWNSLLQLDRKNDKIFLIITPGRTYIIECTDANQCVEWLERLQQVNNFYFHNSSVNNTTLTITDS